MHTSDESLSLRGMFAKNKVAVLVISAVVAVGACVIAPLTDSYLFVLAPLVGLITIVYAIIARSIGGVLLGVLDIFFPIAMYVVVVELIGRGWA